jgi:hypothetical protein
MLVKIAEDHVQHKDPKREPVCMQANSLTDIRQLCRPFFTCIFAIY